MADSVNVEQQAELHLDTGTPGSDVLPANNGIVIFNIDGPVFFGAAEKLERTLAHIQRPATTLILRMGNVPFVDATGIFAIEEIISDFKRHGATVLLVELRSNVRYKLERGGVIAHAGADNVIDTLEQALLRAKELQAAACPQALKPRRAGKAVALETQRSNFVDRMIDEVVRSTPSNAPMRSMT